MLKYRLHNISEENAKQIININIYCCKSFPLIFTDCKTRIQMIYESIMNIRKDGHQIGLRFTVYIHILKSGKRFVFISNFHILKIFIFTVMPIKPKNTITVFTVHFSTKLFSGISECLCVCSLVSAGPTTEWAQYNMCVQPHIRYRVRFRPCAHVWMENGL